VVGPDNPLAMGIVDRFQERGPRIWGPNQRAARIESSKVFSQAFMEKYGVPTAAAAAFSDPVQAKAFAATLGGKCAVEADGLALGKGVTVCADETQANDAIDALLIGGAFGRAGSSLIIQELLLGPEISLHDAEKLLLDPWLAGCAAEGIEFHGILYPGVILTEAGPRIFEFNARFGDPEAQVYLPMLDNDLLPLLDASVDGALAEVSRSWNSGFTVCVVVASAGYPGKHTRGRRISGLSRAS
jgi:phosphoribosylamine---glycine ligase